MNKFGRFLKNLFISKFWIKLLTLLLALFAVILLNI
jgi:hypothetical protein